MFIYLPNFLCLDELDSYMYQTVGHQGIDKLAEAMEVPLYRKETFGRSTQTGKYYEPTENDEVEDLYDLLKQIKVKLIFNRNVKSAQNKYFVIVKI